MAPLQDYISQLQHMNRAVMKGYRAPHKPVLLLTIMELMEKGKITDNRIMLNDFLCEEFKRLWKILVDGEQDMGVIMVAEGLELTLSHKYPFKCNIANPYFHMQNEPFWQLIKSDDWKQSSSVSVPSLRRWYQYAELDENLFEMMKTGASREAIRRTLLDMI